jgi:hypothetical protein
MKNRRGQESNLPRCLRRDNGFEDREGHQAPFTLRETQEENVERSTSNVQRRTSDAENNSVFGVRCSAFGVGCNGELPASKEKPTGGLFDLLDRADDGVKVGPVARLQFRVHEVAVGPDFESAAAGRNERERFDAFAKIKNFGRQTDGLGRVVSNDAVFDGNFCFHAVLLPRRWYESAAEWSTASDSCWDWKQPPNDCALTPEPRRRPRVHLHPKDRKRPRTSA